LTFNRLHSIISQKIELFMSREDWNLTRRVNNQSKVSWTIETFKPIKSGIT
jgi:hypothetical protein